MSMIDEVKGSKDIYWDFLKADTNNNVINK